MSELRGGPQVNNFDFVSNLDRQMSLVAGRAETGGRGGGAQCEEGSLYG